MGYYTTVVAGDVHMLCRWRLGTPLQKDMTYIDDVIPLPAQAAASRRPRSHNLGAVQINEWYLYSGWHHSNRLQCTAYGIGYRLQPDRVVPTTVI